MKITAWGGVGPVGASQQDKLSLTPASPCPGAACSRGAARPQTRGLELRGLLPDSSLGYANLSLFYTTYTSDQKRLCSVFHQGWNAPAALTGDCIPPPCGQGIISY